MMTKAKLIAILVHGNACKEGKKWLFGKYNLFDLYRETLIIYPQWLVWLGVTVQPALVDELEEEVRQLDEHYAPEYFQLIHFSDDEETKSANFQMLNFYFFADKYPREARAIVKKRIPVRRLFRWCEVYYEAYVMAHHPIASR